MILPQVSSKECPNQIDLSISRNSVGYVFFIAPFMSCHITGQAAEVVTKPIDRMRPMESPSISELQWKLIEFIQIGFMKCEVVLLGSMKCEGVLLGFMKCEGLVLGFMKI